MEKKLEAGHCIKGLCKAINEYCKSVNCPNRKPINDVEGILMIFFRENGMARIHLLGQASEGEVSEAVIHCLQMMKDQEKGEQLNYAT